MVDLRTNYLGLELRSPILVSASPQSKQLDNIREMEAAGAAAVVMFSYFEEQLRVERQLETYHERNPRATQEHAQILFPSAQTYDFKSEDYLKHLRAAKESVSIPIIASFNCQSPGGWVDFAREIEQTGVDALEVNVYFMPTDMDRTAEQIEDSVVRVVRNVHEAMTIPVSVKICPFFTNMANFARRLDLAGADALVLFNRFYQPDFDPTTLRLRSHVPMGKPEDTRLPMHWTALLYRRIKADLAVTGGIFTPEDVVKMIMVGAKVTMINSVLFQEGIDYLRTLDRELRDWLKQNDYGSIDNMCGIMSRFHSQDPGFFERKEYIRAISST